VLPATATTGGAHGSDGASKLNSTSSSIQVAPESQQPAINSTSGAASMTATSTAVSVGL
jgi:hypothetical protein